MPIRCPWGPMVAEISDQHESEWAAISDVARLLGVGTGIGVARCTVERMMAELGLPAPPGARPDAPRSPTRQRPGPPTLCSGSSGRPPPTGCGWPT